MGLIDNAKKALAEQDRQVEADFQSILIGCYDKALETMRFYLELGKIPVGHVIEQNWMPRMLKNAGYSENEINAARVFATNGKGISTEMAKKILHKTTEFATIADIYILCPNAREKLNNTINAQKFPNDQQRTQYQQMMMQKFDDALARIRKGSKEADLKNAGFSEHIVKGATELYTITLIDSLFPATLLSKSGSTIEDRASNHKIKRSQKIQEINKELSKIDPNTGLGADLSVFLDEPTKDISSDVEKISNIAKGIAGIEINKKALESLLSEDLVNAIKAIYPDFETDIADEKSRLEFISSLNILKSKIEGGSGFIETSDKYILKFILKDLEDGIDDSSGIFVNADDISEAIYSIFNKYYNNFSASTSPAGWKDANYVQNYILPLVKINIDEAVKYHFSDLNDSELKNLADCIGKIYDASANTFLSIDGTNYNCQKTLQTYDATKLSFVLSDISVSSIVDESEVTDNLKINLEEAVNFYFSDLADTVRVNIVNILDELSIEDVTSGAYSLSDPEKAVFNTEDLQAISSTLDNTKTLKSFLEKVRNALIDVTGDNTTYKIENYHSVLLDKLIDDVVVSVFSNNPNVVSNDELRDIIKTIIRYDESLEGDEMPKNLSKYSAALDTLELDNFDGSNHVYDGTISVSEIFASLNIVSEYATGQPVSSELKKPLSVIFMAKTNNGNDELEIYNLANSVVELVQNNFFDIDTGNIKDLADINWETLPNDLVNALKKSLGIIKSDTGSVLFGKYLSYKEIASAVAEVTETILGENSASFSDKDAYISSLRDLLIKTSIQDSLSGSYYYGHDNEDLTSALFKLIQYFDDKTSENESLLDSSSKLNLISLSLSDAEKEELSNFVTSGDMADFIKAVRPSDELNSLNDDAYSEAFILNDDNENEITLTNNITIKFDKPSDVVKNIYENTLKYHIPLSKSLKELKDNLGDPDNDTSVASELAKLNNNEEISDLQKKPIFVGAYNWISNFTENVDKIPDTVLCKKDQTNSGFFIVGPDNQMISNNKICATFVEGIQGGSILAKNLFANLNKISSFIEESIPQAKHKILSEMSPSTEEAVLNDSSLVNEVYTSDAFKEALCSGDNTCKQILSGDSDKVPDLASL